MSARTERACVALLLALTACQTKRIVQVIPDEQPPPAAAEDDDDDDASGGTTRLPDDAPPPLDPSVPQARIVDSSPKVGAKDFYPVEVYDRGGDEGVGERRVLRFTFDRAMETSRKKVGLRPGDRALDGAWSPDAKSFELTLLGTDDASPLEAETEYELDLAELRSDADEPVGTPRVRFTTSKRDSLIEHACIHTLFGPFESVTAAAPQSTLTSAPLASATHKQYSIALPGAGTAYAGDLRLAFSGTGTKRYLLLANGELDVAVSDADGATVAVTPSPTVDACPGIQHGFGVELTRGKTYRLALSSKRADVKAMWEAP
ncbi:MAG: hypothetical protein KIT84_40955 [Labilithrix sp.]|nr:hypothetical protein [Labilithrix sp.]MCW5817440.1 hypothetical protein [Labilithrix sp.]